MSTFKHPAHPWQRDSLVVAVETVVLCGARVPLSYSQVTVEDRQITTSLHYPIAWAKSGRGGAGRPTAEQLRLAVVTAHTLRTLTPRDLADGDTPWNVLSLLEKVLRIAARTDSLLVMHDPERDLPPLLEAVEAWLDVDLPPLSVVSTGVLERARHLGLSQEPGESAAAFYQRIASAPGDLPDLLSCHREQEWTDEIIKATDRMFPAFATCMIYQHHFKGRLLRAGRK
jgi:hypothetical protein